MNVSIDDNYHDGFDTYEPRTLQDRMDVLDQDPTQYSGEQKEALLSEFLTALDRGDVYCADENGEAVEWAKQGVLDVFGHLENMERIDGEKTYHDNLTTRPTEGFGERGIRNTDNTTLRAGSYMGDDSSIMPHGFANIGAHVGEGTMIDGHATAATCSRIGEGSHLGDGATLGGVLDPISQNPVYIGSDTSIGANCSITQGMYVGDNVDVAEGTVLNPSLTVYHATPDSEGLEVEELQGEVPDDTKVFQRWVESEASSEIIGEAAYKPAAVALSKQIEGVDDDVEMRESLRDF